MHVLYIACYDGFPEQMKCLTISSAAQAVDIVRDCPNIDIGDVSCCMNRSIMGVIVVEPVGRQWLATLPIITLAWCILSTL